MRMIPWIGIQKRYNFVELSVNMIMLTTLNFHYITKNDRILSIFAV